MGKYSKEVLRKNSPKEPSQPFQQGAVLGQNHLTVHLGICLAVWVAIPELFRLETVTETRGQGLQHEICEISPLELSGVCYVIT